MRIKVELTLDVDAAEWAALENLGSTALVPQDVADYIVTELISVSNAAQDGRWECVKATGRRARTAKALGLSKLEG